MSKIAKLETLLRTEFREFWIKKHASGKQKVLFLPGFEIPRGGSADMYITPKAGTTLCLVHRCDYLAAYKHTVGNLLGLLAHFHLMQQRELREAIRAATTHPDAAELKQGKIDPLKLSKRMAEDLKAGKITLVVVTEVPEVPQQARELEANFFPIAKLLKSWLPSPIRKKKLCQDLEFYSVSTMVESASVTPLADAIKPMLKMSA